ncbi:hypothetical protein GCK32_009108 [Trichostrongylus colubriformis]|uniref:Uncharacterized protein n=1 Tax=Trichostrongylus colubriformis TaxID=6319 RepID=A0AAN8I9W4_TRICO
MTKLTNMNGIRCVVIGDTISGKDMMLKKYACCTGVPYDITNGQVVTGFNGRRCTFVDSAHVNGNEDVHEFLLCVSVARQASVEETVRTI